MAVTDSLVYLIYWFVGGQVGCSSGVDCCGMGVGYWIVVCRSGT